MATDMPNRQNTLHKLEKKSKAFDAVPSRIPVALRTLTDVAVRKPTPRRTLRKHDYLQACRVLRQRGPKAAAAEPEAEPAEDAEPTAAPREPSPEPQGYAQIGAGASSSG